MLFIISVLWFELHVFKAKVLQSKIVKENVIICTLFVSLGHLQPFKEPFLAFP